jgi:conjugative relaxase-like TrwC/TraI family protein
MSAGDGYRYLLKSVVAGDGNRDMTEPLTRYYQEKGSPPGFWIGSALPALQSDQIHAGAEVTETQLRRLLGRGHHPETGTPLGSAYRVFLGVNERVARRVEALPGEMDEDSRTEEIARIEQEERERPTRRPVAGFDYTFSVPKSVSVWWAVTDGGTQALIANAHHAAVAEVLDLLERDVAMTRIGHDGLAQVEVTGILATAFDHYDSRANDPQLHTHVVIANRVRGAHDGKWRAIDGRPMHAAVVALSEHYNNVLADRLTRDFGLAWEARPRGERRAPAWEIAGVPDELLEEFSSRSRAIDTATDELIDRYVQRHGRRPSNRAIIRLRAEATLTTRPDKTVHSLSELTEQWRARAGRVLGQDATGWARSVPHDAAPPVLLRADDIPLEVLDQVAATVVDTVGQARSTWRRWNLHAEASRMLKGDRFATTIDREAVLGLIVDRAEDASVRLTPPELASSPDAFRRPDGTSTFRIKHGALYTSTQLLAAEDHLLTLAHTTTAPDVAHELIGQVTRRKDRKGRRLSPDQAAAVTLIASSGRTVDVLIGPAGTGKTTTLASLRRAWELTHGRESVIGLATSADAAQVLAADLGIPTENTAKWLHEHQQGHWQLEAGQLMIVDEASLSGTLALDRLATHAEQANAKLLLVGDWAQLGAVEAGGALGLIARDLDHTPELHDVRRLRNPWEQAASLRLRLGEPDAISDYDTHGRIHGADYDSVLEHAYQAWRDDTANGKLSILVAETVDTVAALNTRARTDRLLSGHTDDGAAIHLSDGTDASAGDLVITRKNDRRLNTGGARWVRNGDRWRVTTIHRDGSVTVRRHGPRFGGAIRLPADYASEHLDLGYAITVHRAQGATVDTAHAIVHSNQMTRESLYVAMTRGREANTAYVAIDQFPLEEHQKAPDPEVTARSVLAGVLAHETAERSAHEVLRAEQEQWSSIEQLAGEYDTIAEHVQHDRWIALLEHSGLTREQVDQIVDADAFGTLTAELRRADAEHHDLPTLLPRLISSRPLDDTDDLAAVIRHRLRTATTSRTGSTRARKPPRLIAGLIYEVTDPTDPETRHALDERRTLIEQRAHALAEQAVTDRASWLGGLGAPPTDPHRHAQWMRQLRIIAAYRDRYGITDQNSPLGAQPRDRNQATDAIRAHDAHTRARRLSAPPPTPSPHAAVQTSEPRL